MGFFKRFRLRRGERHPALHPRRRWLRFAAIASVSLAAMIIMLYFLRVPVRDDLISRVLVFAESQGFQTDYRSVWGNLFGGISFDGLRVWQDKDHYLEADRFDLSYRLLPLVLEQRFELRAVRVVNPRGRWLLPPEPPKESKPLDPNFALNLDALIIQEGHLEIADTLALEGINLNLRLRVRPHRLDGELRRASLVIKLRGEERLRFRKAQGEFSYTYPDTIDLVNLLIATDESLVKGYFHIKGSSWDVGLKEAKLDLAEVDPANLSGQLIAEGRIAEDSTGYTGNLALELKNLGAGKLRLADMSLDMQGRAGVFNLSLAASDAKLGRVKSFGTLDIGNQGPHAVLRIEEIELYKATGLPMRLRGDIAFGYLPREDSASADLNIESMEVRAVADVSLSFKGRIAASYKLKEGRGEVKGLLEDIRIQMAQWGSARFDCGFKRDKIELREVLVTHGISRMEAKGELSRDTLDASLDIQGFQLASLGKLNPLGKPAEVDASLRISGSKDSPKLSGMVLLRSDGKLFRQAYLELDSFDPLSFSGLAIIKADEIKGPQDAKIDLGIQLKDRSIEASATNHGSLALSTGGMLTVDWTRGVYEYYCQELSVVSGSDSISNRNPFVLGQAGDSVYLGPAFFDVGNGELGATGTWKPGELPNWSFSLSNIEVATIGRMIGLPKDASGLISGQIVTRESDRKQQIIVDLWGAGIHLADFDADTVTFFGTLDTSRIDLEASLLRGKGLSTAKGHLYFDLKDGPLVRSFDVAIALNDIGVWPFAFLKDIIDIREGLILGELYLKGTPAEPSLEGWVRVSEATLNVPIVDLTGDRINASLLFSRGTLIIDTLKAYVESGTIEGRGNYAIFKPGHPFYFGLSFGDVLFSPERRIHATCGGNITIQGTDTTPLKIAGKIDIKEALMTYELWDEIRVIAPLPPPDPSLPPPPPVYLDLAITGEKNLWVRNDWMDVEIIPNIQVIQRNEIYPQIIGKFEVKRGSIYYLDHTLRIDEGKITFPPTQTLDPELDLWASELTSKTYSKGGTPRPIKIILHMGGTFTKPVLEFFSDPPVWSESQITQYLHLHVAPGELVREDYGSALSEALITLAERYGSGKLRDLIGLDVLSVETLASTPTKVTFGKYIGERWFASYTYALAQAPSNPNQHQFIVEYELGKMRNQEIVLERDEKGSNSLRYQIRIRY